MAAAQTVLTTLKSLINFPLSEESYNTFLINSDLDGDAVYTKELRRDVELAAADLILIVCTSGNVTEGGYSLTVNDKASLRITRKIYLLRWGMPDIEAEEGFIYDATGMW
jgi:hypothetical protein